MADSESIGLAFTVMQTLLIVASLVAVWWQLKQANDIAKVHAYEKHMEDYSHITRMLIEKSDLNEIFYSKNPDFLKLSPQERDFYNYLGLAFGFQERLWVSYDKGLTDDKTWESWDRWFAEQWFPLEIFGVFWSHEGRYFITPFYEAVNAKYETYKRKQAQSVLP